MVLGDTLSSSPHHTSVASDPNGDSVVVWDTYDTSYGNIWFEAYVPVQGWTESGVIAANITGASFPHVRSDDGGHFLAIWQQAHNGHQDVMASWFSFRDGWAVPAAIENIENASPRSLALSVGPLGDAAATWLMSDGSVFDVYVCIYDRMTGWGSAQVVDTDENTTMSPDVGVDVGGNVVVLWAQQDGSRYNIWSRRCDASYGWGSPTLIEIDLGYALSPELSMSSDGFAFATWAQYDGSGYAVWGSICSPIGGWSFPAKIGNGTVGDLTYAPEPQVSSAAQGRAIVVWDQLEYGLHRVYSSMYVPGLGWSSQEKVDIEDSLANSEPQVALSSSGKFTVVWVTYDGQLDHVLSRRYSEQKGWQPVTPIEISDNSDVASLALSTDDYGDALVVWSGSEPTGYVVVSNSYVVDREPPVVHLTSPVKDIVNVKRLNISGVTDPSATVIINGFVVAVNSSGNFSFEVGLVEGVNLVYLTASDDAGVTHIVLSITRDTAAPFLTITAPTNNSRTDSSTAIVSGTTEPGVSVAVDDILANVTDNGSFEVLVPLQEGKNLITVSATDQAGNSVAEHVTIEYRPRANPANQYVIILVGAFGLAVAVVVLLYLSRPRKGEKRP